MATHIMGVVNFADGWIVQPFTFEVVSVEDPVSLKVMQEVDRALYRKGWARSPDRISAMREPFFLEEVPKWINELQSLIGDDLDVEILYDYQKDEIMELHERISVGLSWLVDKNPDADTMVIDEGVSQGSGEEWQVERVTRMVNAQLFKVRAEAEMPDAATFA